VIIGVVSNFMAFVYNSPNQFWVALRIYSTRKNAAFTLAALDIEDLRGPLRVRSSSNVNATSVDATRPLMVEGRKFRKFRISRR